MSGCDQDPETEELDPRVQDELEKLGIIFCSISEAANNHPELLKKYLASN